VSFAVWVLLLTKVQSRRIQPAAEHRGARSLKKATVVCAFWAGTWNVNIPDKIGYGKLMCLIFLVAVHPGKGQC